MSTSKFRIKMGEIEVEYEGNDEFLKKELPDLLAAVSKLHKESGGVARAAADSLPAPKKATAPKTPRESGGAIAGTTASIAAKLGCKSGGDLVIAAAAQLTFVEGMATFTRKELTDACRAGKNYFKQSYGKNLSVYLATLIAGKKINEVSDEVYALSAAEVKALEAKLASE